VVLLYGGREEKINSATFETQKLADVGHFCLFPTFEITSMAVVAVMVYLLACGAIAHMASDDCCQKVGSHSIFGRFSSKSGFG
jgi:hypothetical protein